MESVQLLAEQSEVLGGHVLSLPNGDVLRDSGIIFTQDGLSSNIITDSQNEEVQSFMSLPVHVLQDSSFGGPILVKNAAGQTFLIDPRQCSVIGNATDEAQSQYILAPGTDSVDADQAASGIMGLDMDFSYITNVGNVVLGENAVVPENNVDGNQSTILQLGSQVLQGANKLLPEGMCIDMSQLSIVTSNGVVSYVTSTEDGILSVDAEAQHELPDPTTDHEVDIKDLALQTEEEIALDDPEQVEQEISPSVRAKRGRGRPRKSDPQQDDVMDPPVGKPPYKCDTCGYEAALWGRLKRHKESHKNEKPHRCKECGASYNVEINLTLHMATHSQGELKCPECQRVFSRVASLRSHLMMHEREDNLFCTECGDEFALQYQLDSHVMEHQDEWVAKNLERIYECVKCQRQFSRASALKEHMREHVKVKHSLVRRKHDRSQDRSDFSHKCPTCGKVFQKPSQLVRHMRIHTGERPYPCDVCGKAFSQKGSLQIHMTKHNGDKPYQCDFCSARFSQKGNLRAHIQRVHSIPQQGTVTYQCTECPCMFRKLGSLNSHMGRAHNHQGDTTKSLKNNALSSEQMMQVNVNQIMAQLAALEKATSSGAPTTNAALTAEAKEQSQHVSNFNNPQNTENSIMATDITSTTAKDTGPKDILQQAISKSGLEGKAEIEPVVGKEKTTPTTGFITLADKSLDGTVRRYTIRQRRVEGVRWHQCSYCCKEFKKPSDLVRHIRVHTHEKPYKCPHCFRAFSVKSTLTAHIRTHGGLKHYSCAECNKKFSSGSSLKVHMRLHNGEKPFSCNVCNRTFRTSGHRQTHSLTHCATDATMSTPRKRKRKLKKQELQPGENLPDVLLEEPIVITETGSVQDDVMKPTKPAAPKAFSCDQCTAAFRKRSHLNMHMRSHTGERPFQCNICNRSFVSNGVLKSHILTHEAVKPFKCDICAGTFSTQGSLKRHLIIHNTNKPFMCPYCHKTFKNRINCKNHIKNHKVEVARAVAQQANELQEQQFVVSVGDDFNGGEIIVPNYQAFSSDALGADGGLGETVTVGDKLLHTGVITHTLLADASGTITLPASLTQENIREIEDTLNQQLSSVGGGTVLINATEQGGIPLSALSNEAAVQGTSVIDFAAASEAAHAEDVAAAANLAASEAPTDSGLNDNSKGTTLAQESSDLSSAIFGQAFDQQGYDTCTFPTITLQGDQLNLAGIEQGATLSANMEAILPQSRRNAQNDKTNSALAHDDVTDIGELCLNDVEVHSMANEQLEETDKIVAPENNSGLPTCETCNKTFKRLSQLKLHMRSVHGVSPKPNMCSRCDRSFSSANALRLHARIHNEEKSHACEHCSLTFSTMASLTRHMTVHTDNRPYSCAKCSTTFRTQMQLRKHAKSHDPTYSKRQRTGRKFPAIIFSEEQTTALATQNAEMAGTVSEQMLIASAIETVEMSKIANAEGSKKFDLETVFANRCKFCPKSFRKPSDLVRHVRIHTGERPFRCDYCYRSFTVKSTLISHQKTHMADMPKKFPCHVCNLRFSTKGSLKVHIRLHTGYKPFKCPICSARFRTSGHRKAHIQTHMNGSTSSRARKNHQILSIPEEEPNDEVGEILEGDSTEVHQVHQIMTEDGSVLEVDSAALLAAGATLDGTSLQLQINDEILQQLQLQNGGNVVIQENGTVEFVTNGEDVNTNEEIIGCVSQINMNAGPTAMVNHELPSLLPSIEEMDVVQQQEELEQQDAGNDGMAGMHFEIHTDEHGQIVNIQQTLDGNGVVLADMSDTNIGDVTRVIDGSQFILDNVTGVDTGNEDHSDGFVTLDISDIIMPPPPPAPTTKKGKGGKAKGDSSGPTSHICSVCGKVFSKPSQLQRHVRIHTGERPFPCTQCWKAFNQKNALKAHMKRHTGERPYKCPHCDHAFTQRGNLKTHIGRAHPHSTEAVIPKKRSKKAAPLPKNPILDNVSFGLDLDGVVGDLFPQMQNTAVTEAD